MVVTSDILPSYRGFQLVPGRIYVFESTFSYKIPKIIDASPNVVTGKGKFGVQLRDLEELMPTYLTSAVTKIAWCRLLNNPYLPREGETPLSLEVRRKAMALQFRTLFHKYQGRSYQMSMVSLLGAMFPALRCLRTAQDAVYSALGKVLKKCGMSRSRTGPAGWQFCSELVANIYQAYGIIPDSLNPEDVLPIDFFGYDEDGMPPLVDRPLFIVQETKELSPN
jgi:hypothetical protein